MKSCDVVTRDYPQRRVQASLSIHDVDRVAEVFVKEVRAKRSRAWHHAGAMPHALLVFEPKRRRWLT